MATVRRITVYPIKSFDGHDLESTKFVSSGGMVEDRRFALVDSWGKYINGKTCAEIHRIRAVFEDDLQAVVLSCEGSEQRFELPRQGDELAVWCGEALGKKCRLTENADGGFPDDSELPGPTIVSTATLEAVAAWYNDVGLDEVRRRFRFNIEIGNTPAFWEDGLVPEIGQVRRFRIGELVWQGSGICKRCIVPTRDSLDGSSTAGFAKDFVRNREQALPAWSPPRRFDTFYRLGVNTRVESETDDQMIRCGDLIEVLD